MNGRRLSQEGGGIRCLRQQFRSRHSTALLLRTKPHARNWEHSISRGQHSTGEWDDSIPSGCVARRACCVATAAELALIESRMAAKGVSAVVASHWADGGRGAEDLAHAIDITEDGKVVGLF